MLCTVQSRSEPENVEDEPDPQKMLKEESRGGSVVLKNKAPRWHEHLQCWCLNFHGRVTVASVKNFQLVAAADPSQPEEMGDEETVLLQFGKVGDDMFTMDYRQPLSAFQAFAICLTSFGMKFACEQDCRFYRAMLNGSALVLGIICFNIPFSETPKFC